MNRFDHNPAEENDSIDLLIADASDAIHAPASLQGRIDRAVNRVQRRRRMALTCAAAIPMLAAMFLVIQISTTPDERAGVETPRIASKSDQPVESGLDAPGQEQPQHRARVRFASNENIIVVPAKPQRPNITIMQVYRAAPAHPQPEPEDAQQPAPSPDATTYEPMKEFIG